MPRGDLERGWAKTRLIRELAAGGKTQSELAVEYGVVQSAVAAFSARHADEITALKTRIEDEWAALWAADKFNRVAELQADIESIKVDGTFDVDKLLRVKHAALRQIAEELGQLKTTVEVGGKVTYVIEGIDASVLR